MPQPDNQRERGAATAGSQRQVAPQGQMAANISPVSGGAAAAAPVLQIGQQGQIKQTGAELYQAISGISQGIQQGLQNYEKMYNFVSEAQYAEFETAYVTEYDRVKGDPSKLKTWLDNSTYKPNRATAKKYHTLRAEVNGKAYEQDQEDQWEETAFRISKMDTVKALDYLNSRIDQYDENSPYHKKAYAKIIELQGSVANTATQINLQTLRQEIKQTNLGITETLKQNPTYAQSLSDPAYQLALTLSGVGQANIDAANGQVTLSSGETFDLNSAGDFIPRMRQILDEGMSSGALRPDYVAQSMMAANLPDSVLGRNSAGAIDPPFKLVAELRRRLSIGNGGSIRSFLGNELPATKENLGQTSKTLDQTFSQIVSDQSISETERARQLQEMLFALDYESGKDLWMQYGIENEDQFKAAFDPFKDKVNDAFSLATIGSMQEAFAKADSLTNSATDTTTYRTVMQNVFNNDVLPAMASISNNGNIILFDPATNRLTKLSVDEYEEYVATSGTSQITDEGRIPNLIPRGIEVIDKELEGAKNVPFMVLLDENNQFVFTGTGSKSTRAAQGLLETTQKNWTIAQSAENLQLKVQQDPEYDQLGFVRLAEQNPIGALGIFGDPKRAGLGTLFPSGKTGDPAFNAIMRVANPSAIAQMEGEARNTAAIAFGMAYNGSPEFKSRVDAMFPGAEDTNLITAFALGSKNDPTLSGPQWIDSNVLNQILSDDPTSAEEAWQQVALERANADYREITGGQSLLDDLLDPDRSAATYTWLGAHMKGITDISRLGNVSDKTMLMQYVRDTPLQPDRVHLDGNDLYAPGGLSMTLQDQAIVEILDKVKDEDISKVGVGPAFGLGSDAEVLLFKRYLKGQYEPPAPLERKFSRTRRQLRKGINAIPVPVTGKERATVIDSESGMSYRPVQYAISISEDMVQKKKDTYGPLSWLLSTLSGETEGEGATPEMFEILRRTQYTLGTIERWKYGETRPAGILTGMEVLQQQGYRSTPEDAIDEAQGAFIIGPSGIPMTNK